MQRITDALEILRIPRFFRDVIHIAGGLLALFFLYNSDIFGFKGRVEMVGFYVDESYFKLVIIGLLAFYIGRIINILGEELYKLTTLTLKIFYRDKLHTELPTSVSEVVTYLNQYLQREQKLSRIHADHAIGRELKYNNYLQSNKMLFEEIERLNYHNLVLLQFLTLSFFLTIFICWYYLALFIFLYSRIRGLAITFSRIKNKVDENLESLGER